MIKELSQVREFVAFLINGVDLSYYSINNVNSWWIKNTVKNELIKVIW